MPLAFMISRDCLIQPSRLLASLLGPAAWGSARCAARLAALALRACAAFLAAAACAAFFFAAAAALALAFASACAFAALASAAALLCRALAASCSLTSAWRILSCSEEYFTGAEETVASDVVVSALPGTALN